MIALSRPTSAFRNVAVAVLLALIVGPGADAAQLTASWVDNSGGDASFEIVRRTSDETTYAILADLPRGSLSYIDASVIEGVTYCYRVKAYTDVAESPYSDEACGAAAPSTFTITVTKAGTGAGTVTSSGSGMVCGWTCIGTFDTGTPVTLTAIASSGSRFAGWRGGGCWGAGRCTVTANTPVTVTAVFVKAWLP